MDVQIFINRRLTLYEYSYTIYHMNTTDVDTYKWFEEFTKFPKTWLDLENPRTCPFPHFKLHHHHERVFIQDMPDEIEFIAWLFHNHCASKFAPIMQDDDRKGELEPRIYSLRGSGPISGYITGVLFNDDLLMIEFKLRYGEIIKA